MFATVEKGLRTSFMRDDPQLYTSPLPRRPMDSHAWTVVRTNAANGRSQEQLRSLHVAHWSENMGNSLIRSSTYLRTRLAALAPNESIDWAGSCVPLTPRSVWPGVSLKRDAWLHHSAITCTHEGRRAGRVPAVRASVVRMCAFGSVALCLRACTRSVQAVAVRNNLRCPGTRAPMFA